MNIEKFGEMFNVHLEPGMKIRRMIEAELDRVVELWHFTKKVAYPYLPLEQACSLEEDRTFFLEKVLSRCDVWVADDAGKIAGFLAINGSYIDRLYILPALQANGIGASLVRHAKELSPSGLELHTHRKNTVARKFYMKLGFHAIRFGISPPPESEPDVEFHWRPGDWQAPEEEIHVVPYDRSWPMQFTEEQEILHRILGNLVVGSIEHIGSTAVPGLLAKPVIDMMVGVRSLQESRPAITLLEEVEYCYHPFRSDSMHWFCKPAPSFRTHHLHLVPFESRLWLERITFRNYLRSHADAAAEYAELKQRLAQLHRFDRETYTDSKGPFVERILALALEKNP